MCKATSPPLMSPSVRGTMPPPSLKVAARVRPFQAHLPLLAFLLASIPLAGWYGCRMTDGSDEPMGILALCAALAFAVRQRQSIRLRPMVLAGGALLLATAWHLLQGRAPLLVGGLFVAVLGCALHLPRGKSGTTMLLILSLPLLASLDFYAGYPLRLITAEASARLLQCMGVDVTRAGVLLEYGGRLVGVDAPCAGVRMLWTGAFVAAVLATLQQCRAERTMLLQGAALAGVLAGNIIRATILFFPESGLVQWPHWTHEAIGLGICAAVLAMLTALSSRLGHPRVGVPTPGIQHLPKRTMTTATVLAVGTCFLLLTVWLSPSHSSPPALPTAGNTPEIPWPATLDGIPLEPQPLTPREETFARSFPGALARFRCGDAEVILRHVTKLTRRLHSSSDCLRAAGFRIRVRPVTEDRDGRVWGQFEASNHASKLHVMERVITPGPAGPAFTDVSSWYWHALWHPGEGPWLAMTVLRASP